MAKQSKKVELDVTEFKGSKKGANRDPKALEKLSLKLGLVRQTRLSA